MYPEKYISLITAEVEQELTSGVIESFTLEALKEKAFGPLTPLPGNWFGWGVSASADFIDYALTRFLNAYVHELQVDDGWSSLSDPLRDDLLVALWGPMSETQRKSLISGIRELIRVKLILRRRWPDEFTKPRL